jgi:glycosyltransferase involved in cell wall biosynthesis
MEICIDGTPLLTNSAGIKTYLFHWIKSLRASQGDRQLCVFPMIGELGLLDHEHSVDGTIATRVRLTAVGQLNKTTHLDWLAAMLSNRAEVFHVSNLLQNPPRKQLVTTTIHDLTTWIVPELHTPQNVAADRIFAERVVKKAQRCIAVSYSSRKDAVEILGIPEDKIDVIHHGVADSYIEVSDGDASRVAEKYQIKRPYILFHGAIEPRKNIDLLLDAYQALPGSLRDEFDLVLTGIMGWAARPTIARLETLPSNIRYLGYVPEKDMPGLTRGAVLFAYPSLYEGFGFPVLQAMACGTPTITSNISSLPEIAGDVALLVDPRSLSELREAMEKVLLSPSLRMRMAEQGRERAKGFRWPDAAAKSWAFFERTLGGKIK